MLAAVRRHALFGVLFLMPLTVIWRVFLCGETFHYEDLTAGYFPREELLMRVGPVGWNPHVFFGMSLAGDPGTAASEPVRAFCRWLMLPARVVLACWITTYLCIATAGAYVLARRKGANPFGAALSVLALIWGGMFVVRFHHPSLVQTLSLLPWIVLCADRLLESRKLGYGLAIGVLMAWAVLGGHPQPPYMIGLFVVAWLVVGICLEVSRGQRLRALWAVLWRLSVGFLFTAGLVAFYYVPVVSTLLSSARGSHTTLQYATAYSWDPRDWVRLLAPDLYGNDLAGGYFGDENYHEHLVYIGVAPLLLIALALGWRGRRSERHLLGLAAGSALLACGRFSPLYYLFYFAVPGFKLFRCPARYAWFAELCAALIAGVVLSEMFAGARPPRDDASALARRIRVGSAVPAALLVVVAVFAMAWPGFDQLTGPGVHRTVAWAATRGALLLASGAWVIDAWLRRGWGGRRTANCLLLLTGLDVGLQWLPYRQTAAPAAVFPAPEITAALTAIVPERSLVQAYRSDGNVEIEPLLNWGEAVGYYGIRGYNQGVAAEVGKLFARGDLDKNPHGRPPEDPPIREPSDWLLDLAGVRRIAARVGEWPARLRDLPLVARAGNWEVRERTPGLPRAWLVSATEVLNGNDALERLASLDLRRSATVEMDVGLPASDGGDAGSARLSSWSPDETLLDVDALRPALVVLTDAYAPGWQAYVDDIETPITKTDYLFRGVRTEPGHHRVAFRYRIPGRELGRTISGATMLALACTIGLLALRRARAASLSPRSPD